jgi:hypothetical protein
VVGDFDGDGFPDLYGIKTKNTGSGNMEVHVLSGASRYQQWLVEIGTPIAQSDAAQNYQTWAAADYNLDGAPDLFGIKVKNTGTNTVEVHALSGA